MYEKHIPQPVKEYPKWVRKDNQERLVQDRYEEEKVLEEWSSKASPDVTKDVDPKSKPKFKDDALTVFDAKPKVEPEDLPPIALRKNGK